MENCRASISGASRDRTDDLLLANFGPAATRRSSTSRL
jgi:hypothetical protein